MKRRDYDAMTSYFSLENHMNGRPQDFPGRGWDVTWTILFCLGSNSHSNRKSVILLDNRVDYHMPLVNTYRS